ncbi:MAG: NifU family protein [bacterium]
MRPFLRAEGGDIELIGMVGNTVRLRLTSANNTCPSGSVKSRIEHRLREEIPHIEAVEVVNVYV